MSNNDIIKLPITKTIIEQQEIDGELVDVEKQVTEYLELPQTQNIVEKNILIKSLPYLPEFLQDKPVMKDATILLDALISDKESVAQEIERIKNSNTRDITPVDWSAMQEIYAAYCDTLYKLPGYNNLSYGAKLTLLKEDGFDYVLDLLLHAYDEDYEQLVDIYKKDPQKNPIPTYEEYVKQNSDSYLTKLTMLFGLIKVLKGKTAGLELVFNTLPLPEFLYLTWDVIAKDKGVWDNTKPLPMPGGDIEVEKGDVYQIVTEGAITNYIFNGVAWHICTDIEPYTKPREQFTGELCIYGKSSTTLQAKITNFVRSYMLPYIDVTLQFRYDVDAVYAFPSGHATLVSGLVLSNYIDEQGQQIIRNLQHFTSDENWGVAKDFALDTITLGKPEFTKKGFQGEINLSKSFVIDKYGELHYLFGEKQVIPEIITGPARNKYTDEGTIVDYNGDYLQAPLLRGYVDIDIVTGDQKNPVYVKNELGDYDLLDRDTIVKFYTLLTVEAIHHNKFVEDLERPFTSEINLNQVYIEDFEKELTAAEVYAGRTTFIHTKNTNETFTFETIVPETRKYVGIEGPHKLQFTNGLVHKDSYTGIGDLGILGANRYFIYNGMLLQNINGTYEQLGEDTTWSDVGASHAVSELYFTPAINNGKLYAIKENQIEPIVRDPNVGNMYKEFVYNHPDKTVEELEAMTVEELNNLVLYKFKWYQDTEYWDKRETNNWNIVTGYMDDQYTAFGICDGYLYKLYKNEYYTEYNSQPKLVFCQLDSEQGWTYVTGVSYLNTYEAYGIKKGKLYRITSQGIKEVKYNEEELIGWDSSFDCVGRYHHTNPTYMTYGICDGKLYGLQAEDIILIDDETGWTHVCGFYNDESPRTYGFGIKDGKLYDLIGTTISQRGTKTDWVEICGCTTTTNTFALAIDGDGYIYEVNAKTLKKLYETDGWTHVFGRYTTSTSKSANCYGYGIKNKKLYILHKDFAEPLCISGMWKLNGRGPSVDLLDYGIKEITFTHEGVQYVGRDAILAVIPLSEDDPESNYDIYVEYETIGFEDNERYNIRSEIVNTDYTFIEPAQCKRYEIYLDNAPAPFNTTTGIYNDFTKCRVIPHGTKHINGNGEAFNFQQNESYLELPNLDYYNVSFEYAHKQYGPFKFDCTPENVDFITTNNFMTPTEYEDPNQFDNDIIRKLNLWEENYIRPIDFLLTIRDTYHINVTVEQEFDEINQVGIAFGELEGLDYSQLTPVTSDINGETGIYYGTYNDNKGAFVKFSGDVSGYTQILVAQDVEKYYLKLVQSQYGWNVFISLDNETFDKVFTSTQTRYMNYQCFLGGYHGEYGNCVIYLKDCYVKGTVELPLYENGYYVTVNTQEQDYIQHITTAENQEGQKVIEVRDSQNNLIQEFGMNTLYDSRSSEVIKGDLTVTDTYTVNKLNEGLSEGTTTTTLTYSGEFTLDPEKAVDVGELKETSKYYLTSVASEFNRNNYLLLNPVNMDTPLQITTGDNVEQQYLFDSEEDSIITNKPLLVSQVDGEYVGSEHAIHFVPSGEETELITDTAGTVTKTLVYNNNAFAIDEEKIQKTDPFNFNTYTAIMSGFKVSDFSEGSGLDDETMYDQACTILIDTENGTQLPDGTIDTLPELQIHMTDTIKQKVMSYDGNAVRLGDLVKVEPPTEEPVEGEENTESEAIQTLEDEEIELPPVFEDEETKYERDDTVPYVYTEDTDYQLKWNIKREYVGLNTKWLIEHNPQTEPKDKFKYIDGVVYNFSETNMFEIKSIKDNYGCVLCMTTNDDPSVDQGLLQFETGSLCIKDSYLTWVTKQGGLIKSTRMVFDNDTFYIALRNLTEETEEAQKVDKAVIYASLDGEYFTPLFEDAFTVPITNNVTFGYAEAGSGYLPFNGKLDLTRSYMEQKEQVEEEIIDTIDRFFLLTQTGKLYIKSLEETEYTEIYEFITPYAIYDYQFGYCFNGTLDLYASDLLQPYELGWVDNGILLNDKVRTDLQEADPEYNPDTDPKIYGLEAYGVHLDDVTPTRWDEIHITYVTVDKAYYMAPNTQYFIKCVTDIDTESGKCNLTYDGEADWNYGVLDNIQATDIYTLDIKNAEYTVIKIHTSNDIDSVQGIIGYDQNNTKSIVIKDKYITYFDDTDYIPTDVKVRVNTDYWIKVYSTNKNIETSLDGTHWTETTVQCTFNNYLPITIGTGYTDQGRTAFTGVVDLKQCYILTDDVEYMFKPYRRIMPMISANDIDYTPLALVPLLTASDYITFGKGFDGTLDLFKSNLLLDDTTYWMATKLYIYDKNDELINTLIRDSYHVDANYYWIDSERVIIDPEDYRLHVEGFPLIGDQIVCTHDCYYMFRLDNTTYNFNMEYKQDGWCYISYNEVGSENKYLIYTIPTDRHIVNTGFELNGIYSLKDSTRGGMTLCEYLEWYTYEVNYKKHNDTVWTNWTTFTVERKYALYKRSGYDLKGTHYLRTSYVKMDDLFTPYISFYDSNYIVPKGAVLINNNGIATHYSNNDWLQFKPEALENGCMINVIFTIKDDLSSQGVATHLLINERAFATTDNPYNPIHSAATNYTYCLQYFIHDGMVTMRIIGRNVTSLSTRKSPKHTITVLPCYTDGTFVKNANELNIEYRKIRDIDNYDEFTQKGDANWYPATLQLVPEVTYMDETFNNVYVAKIPFGFEKDMITNANPNRLVYNVGDEIQFRTTSKSQVKHFNIVAYNDLIFKQNIKK